MTTKADWAWRAEFLVDAAKRMDEKADEFKAEAERYRGLAEQAAFLARQDEKPPLREGWHYDRDGYCDNPARGY